LQERWMRLFYQCKFKPLYEKRIVGHVSRDSTAIQSREKPARKQKKPKTCKKRGRPKKGEKRPKEEKRLDKQLKMTQEERLKDLPTCCDVGGKTNSKGNKEYWIGYKCHIDTGDGDIPLSCIVTSASIHDSQVAIPLAEETAAKVINLYDLMDAAYDAPQIKEHSERLGHVPIIDKNHRKNEKEASKREAKAQANLHWTLPEKVRYNQRSSAE
jgi:Transposase DDE domain